MIIILVLVIALLVGGAVAVYNYFYMPKYNSESLVSTKDATGSADLTKTDSVDDIDKDLNSTGADDLDSDVNGITSQVE